MSYPSVDQLQKHLEKEVFHYAKDAKKAAGRALGTLVEIITFYVLKHWDLERSMAIDVFRLHQHPFAVVECKRVGIEEGMKKGPQTIEKAKQGAYVAKSISSLQKNPKSTRRNCWYNVSAIRRHCSQAIF